MMPIAVHLYCIVMLLFQDVQLLDQIVYIIGIAVVDEGLCRFQEYPFAIVVELAVMDTPFRVIHGRIAVSKLRCCRETYAKQ
jgi:hypothetical protein